MGDRRTDILDAALAVLAEHGMRELTHRAVDGAAGIPLGSTSYYFRSRSALVTGCVERLLQLDLDRELPALTQTGLSFVDLLVAAGVSMATTQRYRTLARYELSLAAVRDPALRAALRSGGDTIRRLAAGALAQRRVADPAAAAEELSALLDGLVFTALVRGPDDPVALAAWLRPPLQRALASSAGRSSADGTGDR